MINREWTQPYQCPKCLKTCYISELAPTGIGFKWRCGHCNVLSIWTDWIELGPKAYHDIIKDSYTA